VAVELIYAKGLAIKIDASLLTLGKQSRIELQKE
jgi:hypothetical protein